MHSVKVERSLLKKNELSIEKNALLNKWFWVEIMWF
jgi:hypothetical protein